MKQMCVAIKRLLCRQAVKADTEIATLTAQPRYMDRSSKGKRGKVGEHYSKPEAPTADETFAAQFL